MCNFCDCENYDRCSIIGNIPMGFCCPKCVNFNEERSCKRSVSKVEERQLEQAKSLQVLHETFAKSSFMLNKLKNYP
jgi:hypothetical protein